MEEKEFIFDEEKEELRAGGPLFKKGVRVRIHDTAFSKKPPNDVLQHIYKEGKITGLSTFSGLSGKEYSVAIAYRFEQEKIGSMLLNGGGIKSFTISRELSALRYIKLI